MKSVDSIDATCNIAILLYFLNLSYIYNTAKIKIMKKISLLLAAISITLVISAQGNSQGKDKDKQKDKTEQPGKDKEKGKENDKEKNKEKEEKEKKVAADHDKKVWDGTFEKETDGPQPSKNQPTQVTAAFKKDYPNATNVSWSKFRGDWTATFRNGASTSTAVYHANGERKDTRTPVTRNEMPRKVVDSIFKRRPTAKLDDVVKVEGAKGAKEIYRVKDIIEGKPQYVYYNAEGLPVKYDY